MIGESEGARKVARSSLTPRHARPLGPDAEFIEAVLVMIKEEIEGGSLKDGAPVTFVLYRLFGISPLAAPFGNEVNLVAERPKQGSVYITSEGFHTSERIADAGTSRNTQETVVKHKMLQDHTRITFEPVSRRVTITCEKLGYAPLKMKLAPDQIDWSADRLEHTVDVFHDERIDEGLGPLLSDDEGLKKNAVAVYRTALYMYLRFEVGLDEGTGYKVSTSADSVVLQERRVKIAVLTACGVRHGWDPSFESKRLDRLIAAKLTTASKSHPARIRLSCLGCQLSAGSYLVEAVPEQNFLLRHHHVCEPQ